MEGEDEKLHVGMEALLDFKKIDSSPKLVSPSFVAPSEGRILPAVLYGSAGGRRESTHSRVQRQTPRVLCIYSNKVLDLPVLFTT